MRSPADWQLPPGVNRGLWDYLHDPELARRYDASLADKAMAVLSMAAWLAVLYAGRMLPFLGRSF